jgi:hypothetical protein
MNTSVLNNLVIILASVSAAMAFLYAVRRGSTEPTREKSNDFTSAVGAVIGTTYAVLLAFMLGGVWNMFREAEANAKQEAPAVINIYRIASQVKDSNSTQIQETCLSYAENVIIREFPALEKGDQISVEGSQLINQLWKLLEGSQVSSLSARLPFPR